MFTLILKYSFLLSYQSNKACNQKVRIRSMYNSLHAPYILFTARPC